MRKWITLLALLAGLAGIPGTGVAAEAKSVGDPVTEVRLTKITEELRCLTCMGQSIADSHSGFSEDMRREIREMIAKGMTDAQIMAFMVQRYGDFVLYRPPVKPSTWLLWGGPFVLLLVGLWLLIRKLRQRQQVVAQPLSAAEQKAARSLLGEVTRTPGETTHSNGGNA